MILLSQRGTKGGMSHTGGSRLFYAVFMVFLLTIARPAAALGLDEIAKLAKGGAAQLALKLLDKEQPNYREAGSDWMRWERMRVRIMEEHADWQALASSLAKLPDGLPAEFAAWAQGRRARALLMSGHFAESRQLLRSLIWRQDNPPDDKRLTYYRHLVMQSYLHEGRIEDAYAAMLRFHQDYGDGDREAILLRARVLLASDRAGESRPLLEQFGDDPIAHALLLLARLRDGDKPAVIIAAARKQAEAQKENAEARYLLYGTMAEAAVDDGNPAQQIIALENWFRVERVGKVWSQLFHLNADSLWDAYLAYAKRIGNREQLLLGNDEAWFKAAENTDSRYPVRIRSLYALLGESAYQAADRERAHKALVDNMLTLDNGISLVQQLYLHAKRFDVQHPVPASVAYLLVDEAIREGDLSQASRLMQQLPEPPGDTARFAWQMRRAKVFILAGEYNRTVSLLGAIVSQSASLSDEQRDQLIQLLLDLQTVGEYEQAYQLLSSLYQHTPSYKLRRELLFWMGDSRKEQGQYAEAARLYLLSATIIDNASMDPWAQTARYNAAQSLAKADMLDDAAYIYRQLLKVTENPERRAVLRHELEQLLLKHAANEG